MYVVELHDADVEDMVQGTLAATIGRRGTVEYAYQVEIHLQDALEGHWRRAYLKTGEGVKAVWAHDKATGEVQYLARSQDYTGEWVLPFVDSPDAQIAVGLWGRDASTDEEALAWAKVQLAHAITAILLERGDIRFAWELVEGAPQLIARGPSKPR